MLRSPDRVKNISGKALGLLVSFDLANFQEIAPARKARKHSQAISARDKKPPVFCVFLFNPSLHAYAAFLYPLQEYKHILTWIIIPQVT